LLARLAEGEAQVSQNFAQKKVRTSLSNCDQTRPAFAGKLILESLFIDFWGKSGMVYRI
jgi:hypothetical protein